MLSFVGPPVARKWAPASNNYVGSCAGSCTCTSTSPSLPWAKHTRFCPSPKKDQKNGIRWNFSKKKYMRFPKEHHLGPNLPSKWRIQVTIDVPCLRRPWLRAGPDSVLATGPVYYAEPRSTKGAWGMTDKMLEHSRGKHMGSWEI